MSQVGSGWAIKLFVLWFSDEEDNATVPGNASGTDSTAVYTPPTM
jgi:hypothetical protein